MNGVKVPEVSAGSNIVGAMLTCAAQVIWPSGAAVAPAAEASRRRAAMASTVGRTRLPYHVSRETTFRGNGGGSPRDRRASLGGPVLALGPRPLGTPRRPRQGRYHPDRGEDRDPGGGDTRYPPPPGGIQRGRAPS